MKKIIEILIVFLIFGCVLSFNCQAKEQTDDEKSAEEYSQEQIDSSGADKLYDELEKQAQDYLSDIGINSISFDEIFSISPSKVFNMFKSMALGNLEAPKASLIKLLCIIILTAVAYCFIPDDEKYKRLGEIACVLFCTTIIIQPLINVISNAVSAITISCGFMKGLIPVLAGVITAGGNPTLALSFQSLGVYGAQLISSTCEKYLVPVVGCVMALDITGSLIPDFSISSVTDLIRKTIITVLSFVSTMYVSFLGIKGALANSADTVVSKGIKVVLSSAIPVIGSAISEAYSGIIGSLVLVKSTIGIFGIASIAIICMPTIIELLFWSFALKVASSASELFGIKNVSLLLQSLSKSMVLLNVVLLFNAIVFIISTALILVIRAGT